MAFTIDLHSHSTASDGTYTPTNLVKLAQSQGIQVLGITDHDTVGGVAEALDAGQQMGVEVVPGIEFSLKHEPDKQFIGLHLLGYFIDHTHPALTAVLETVQAGRRDQKIRQIELLRSFGFNITVEAVFARATGMPGRPHIAAELLAQHPDRFDNMQQIFDEYLATGAKAHLKREKSLTLADAVAVIKEAGGLPVLAHPGIYAKDGNPLQIIRNAHAEGILGVEVFYLYFKDHKTAFEGSVWLSRVDALANELGLLKTGGSDFHGRAKDDIMLGDMGLTDPQFAALKQGWREAIQQ